MNTIVMFNTYLLLLGRIINLQSNSKCTLYFTTKNFIWLFIEVPVPSTESERSYIFVLWVSILPLSTILILDFGTVPTVWYFGTVPTVWYFGTVPTVWYFGTVPTVRQCDILELFRQCDIVFVFHSIQSFYFEITWCGLFLETRLCTQ
jgi:hypothetical protein